MDGTWSRGSVLVVFGRQRGKLEAWSEHTKTASISHATCLQSMKLHSRLEGDEQKQLIISSALYPVFRRSLCLALVVERAWLGCLPKGSDRASILISVQQLTTLELYLVGDITVTSGDLGTLPCFPASAIAGRFPGRVNPRRQLLDDSLEFARVSPLHLLDDLPIKED